MILFGADPTPLNPYSHRSFALHPDVPSSRSGDTNVSGFGTEEAPSVRVTLSKPSVPTSARLSQAGAFRILWSTVRPGPSSHRIRPPTKQRVSPSPTRSRQWFLAPESKCVMRGPAIDYRPPKDLPEPC